MSVRIAVSVLAPHRPGAVAIRSPRYVLTRSPFHPRSAYLAPGVPRSLVALSLCLSLSSRLIQANPSSSIHLHLLLWPSVAHTLSLFDHFHTSLPLALYSLSCTSLPTHLLRPTYLTVPSSLPLPALTYFTLILPLHHPRPFSCLFPLLYHPSIIVVNGLSSSPCLLASSPPPQPPPFTTLFAPTSLSSTRPSTNPPILATPAPACPPASHTCKQSRNLLSRSAIELKSISISQPIDRDRIREASGTTISVQTPPASAICCH